MWRDSCLSECGDVSLFIFKLFYIYVCVYACVRVRVYVRVCVSHSAHVKVKG